MRDAVHKAFWDTLEEQLSQTPPQYERAVSLLGEIKEVMCDEEVILFMIGL